MNTLAYDAGAVGAGINPLATLITTADQPETKRFAFWREAVRNTFIGLDCQPNSDRSFFGEIATTRVKEIGFSRVRARGYQYHRTPLWIHKDKKEVLFVSLILRGKCLVTQDGRQTALGPGDLSCLDSSRPYLNSANMGDDFEQLILHVPREVWLRRLGSTEQVTARPVSSNTEMGALVANFLRQVVPCIGTVDGATADRLAEASLTLVGAAFGNLISQQKPSQSQGRSLLLYRAKTLIDLHLHDPGLNPEKVAQALRISERYLRDLFHEENSTVSNWIWDRRLEKISQDLSNPLLAGKSLSQIAFNCGFSDVSHFSRRFKAAFSLTPSEFRCERIAKRTAISPCH